jgi:stearoyl-CoA desaturase (delta-9 desaturase)
MAVLIADAPFTPPPALPPPPLVVESAGGRLRRVGVTAVLVAGPGVALGVAVPLLWGHGVHLQDLVIAVILYGLTGHGITIGFHRLFTHRSFKANRGLKIALAAAGSMAIEGSLISWVANHRRHHRYSDHPGDPHSPYNSAGPAGPVGYRGFMHAHVGWLFNADTTPTARYAADLLADNDLVVINRLFPLFALASLALPFGIGYALSGTLTAAISALVWAGIIRMTVLHHVTWSTNSICHLYGTHPYKTADHSTNFAPLALLSMGENWHNLHHAYPSSARHGAGPHQLDTSATLIKLFEKAGWATKVHWPTPQQLAQLHT